MSQRTARAFRPSLAALEGRVVLSADAIGAFVGPVLAPSRPLLPAFDSTLSASIQTYSTGERYIVVDGSDYDDVIQVLDYTPGYNGSIKLLLEKWSNGVRLSSSTATYHGGYNRTLSATSPLTIQARGGNDTILNTSAAPMYASGGDGNDWFYGGSARDFIQGFAGNDFVYGNAGDDYIDGGDGNDTIRAGAGNDTVYGWSGADFLDGEAGNDYVYGFDGDDSLYGGDGDDYVDGGVGNDSISGGLGADRLYGQAGNDVLDGGLGNDRLEGGAGDDYLYGSGGDDTLLGNAGYDRLYGGDGNDRLDAGYRISDGGIDWGEYLHGGAGADVFVRHKSAFGFDDIDLFADYNSSQGDSTDNDWHW